MKTIGGEGGLNSKSRKERSALSTFHLQEGRVVIKDVDISIFISKESKHENQQKMNHAIHH